MEENIRIHRWEHRAIANRPVRAWAADVSAWMCEAYDGRPERLVEEFDRQAQQCVEDGADVVICGCNQYGAALTQVGYREVKGTGVPVVSALPAMIKMAESLVDLKRSAGWTKSEAVLSPYRSTDPQVLREVADRGLGMPELRTPIDRVGRKDPVIVRAA